MLTLLKTLSPSTWLTIAKAIAIISLLSATSWLTWQVAQKDVAEQKLAISTKQLEQTEATTKWWLSEIERTRLLASKAAEADRKLEVKINAILKDHNNAPPLPNNCVIDASGVLSLSAARTAAIETANNSASSLPNN